jgi:hypothetical protein
MSGLIADMGILYCGVNWRGPGRQAKTIENLYNRVWGMNGTKNPHAAATAIAFQNVRVPHALHQFSPRRTSPEGPTQDIAIMGYKAEEKVYTYDDYDNRGYHSTSRGIVQGATWTWLWEDKVEGKPVKGRVTVTEVSPTSYTAKNEYSTDGKTWITLEEGKATKAK